MVIDTLSYVKRLESAGVPRQQAEAHAEAMRAEIVPQVATKADVDMAVIILRKDLDAGLAGVRKDLDAGLAGVRKDLDTGLAGVRKDMDTHAQRIEGLIWKAAFAILGGGLAVGGFLIRFIK